MDFIPRYDQPFTLAEAVRLDVAVITEEITRLQNSLQHLKQTQTVLREYINETLVKDVEPEFTKALEENKIVIGSQEERILILNLALSKKGVHYDNHYDLQSGVPAPPTLASSDPPSAMPEPHSNPSQMDEDHGIHL